MGKRFPIKHEVEYIHQRMRAYQQEAGTYVLWFRFNRESSTGHVVYDEGSVYDDLLTTAVVEQGRDWFPPFRLPVMSVVREEGPEQQTDVGFYTTDVVHLVVSFDQMRRMGFNALDLRAYDILRDRFVYDRVVFKPYSLQVRGQIEDADTVVGIDAREVDPDELTYDRDFERYLEPEQGATPTPQPVDDIYGGY